MLNLSLNISYSDAIINGIAFNFNITGVGCSVFEALGGGSDDVTCAVVHGSSVRLRCNSRYVLVDSSPLV